MRPINTMRVKDCNQLSDILVRLADTGYITCCMMTYNGTTELIKALSTHARVSVSGIELFDPRCNDYNREYYVTLETNLELTVEPAFLTDGSCYLINFADIYFFEGEAHSSALELYQEQECYEIDYIDTIREDLSFAYRFSECSDVYEEDTAISTPEDCCLNCCGDCSNCYKIDPCDQLFDQLHSIKWILDDILE